MTEPDPKPPSRSTPGAGAPLAFLILAGVLIGGLLGQPSIGFLVGLGLGIALAVLLWWRSR